MDGVRVRWVFGVSLVGMVAALVGGSSTQADAPRAANAVAPVQRFVSPVADAGAEVPGLRTATSRTYRRPDGSYRAVVSATPVNYRDAGGAWRAIDTRLESDGAGGLQSKAAATEVALPARLDDPATVTNGDRRLSFELKDAAPVAPDASGATATYADALDGVDASYTAQPSGVKETLTLADEGAPSTYRFALDPSTGLTPELRSDGAVVLRDGTGVVRFWIPAPTVKAAGDGVATTAHVAYHLEDGGRALSVVVDPQWLASARFPVRVDPSVYAGDWTSCTLAGGSLATTSDCNGSSLQVGHDADRTYRSALRFDIAGLEIPQIASVASAELAVTLGSQTTTDAVTQVDVAPLGEPLDPGATWLTYDGTHSWTQAGGDVLGAPPGNPQTMYQDYIPGWVSFDVSAIAESWIRDPAASNGLLLSAHDETADNVLTFDGQSAGDAPVLVVNYRSPTGLAADQTYTSVGIDDNNTIAANVASGDIAVQGKDIHLPGPGGLDLDVGRVFNGKDLGDHNGLFGSAWTETIDGAAFINTRTWYDDARTIYAQGGAVYRFDRDYASDTASTLAYITPPGIDAQLTVDTDTGQGTLTYADGRVWTYAASVDGSRFTLQRIADGQGHHIDLTPDPGDPYVLASITDANDDTLTLSHGDDGQLTQITDADGHHYTYTVDTTDDKDLLTQAENPAGDTISYQYSDDPFWVIDRLDKITDPDGHDYHLYYGPDGDGLQVTKITKAIDTDPDHDQVWQLDYTPDEATGHPCDATVAGQDVIGRTVTTDPEGTQTTYCYNNTGHVIQTWGLVPTVSSVPAISGPATDGAELTASTGTWSGTAPITYTYQWLHCPTSGSGCQQIDDETDSSYVVDSAYVGEGIAVEVTATNAVGSGSATSTQTGAIAAGALSQTGAMAIDGLARVGHTLQLNVGDWAGSGPVSYQYQWQRCDSGGASCQDIAGATQSSYQLGEQDLGHRVRAVGEASNPYFPSTSFTSPTSAIVTDPTVETVAVDMTPVAQPLDPTDDEHIDETAAIINKIAPYHSPDAPCDDICLTAAGDINAMAESLPPDDDVFGPMSTNSPINRLLSVSDVVKRIVQGAGDNIILAGLLPGEIPYLVPVVVVGAGVLFVVEVYPHVMGAPRYTTVAPIAPTGQERLCGLYPAQAYVCPDNGERAIYISEGGALDADGATMPYDGYVYQWKYSEEIGYTDILATCVNYQGIMPSAGAPGGFADRVAANNSTQCGDLSSTAPNEIAVGPKSLYNQTPFTHDPPTDPPATPGDVQMGPDPDWTVPSFGSTKDHIKDGLHDPSASDLAKMLAWEEDRRCHPNPTSDTVEIPTIQDGESGQHYANCLKTLGVDPTIRAKPFADADPTKDPGVALSTSPGAGTQIDPSDPVTVIINPTDAGNTADADTLRDIEAGLIAHNPDLVDTIPNYESEIVPTVALQCAKNVQAAEDIAEQTGVDSTVSEADCGDEQNPGLPMWVSGNTTPQATQNDIDGLKLNPLWTGLNRRLVPDAKSTVPATWKFTRKERQWYKYPPTPGCTTKMGEQDCDEFPYFSTLQGQFGPLKTETPHTEFVADDDNQLQGSLLGKFYSTDGPGTRPWFGCGIEGQPRTDVAAIPGSRFLALPNETIPTMAICNRPRSTS